MSPADTNTAEAYKQQARRYLDAQVNPRLQPLAIAFYQRALALEPGDSKLWLELGAAHRKLGNLPAALACCEAALKHDPDSLEARVRYCCWQIPLLHPNAESVERARRNYHAALLQLAGAVEAAPPERLREAARGAITASMPSALTLTCQDYNAREVQALYGRILCRVMAAAYPQWATPPPADPLPGRRIRIGLVSCNFVDNSHWRMLIAGLVSQLDPDRFAVYCYATGRASPALLDYAVAHKATVRAGAQTLEQWCAAVYSDQLDVLIHPELGSDPIQQRMAALRLAPVQCVAWCNPITSGLPTIDYFLSSDLAEPPGAEAHYTERLIRLPDLAAYIEPTQWQASDEGRAAFGLADSATVYLCTQYLMKYQPQYDTIFPRIAAAVPASQFVFVSRLCPPPLVRQFEQRLERAFAEYGLSAAGHVVILDAMPQPRYRRLTQLCDIFLDNIGYTGFTTTIEAALAPGLPIVTHSGEFMRGRLTLAVLRRIGATEMITANVEAFIDLAVRLGRDTAFRQQMAARITANRHKLNEDRATIAGLETFLEQVVL